MTLEPETAYTAMALQSLFEGFLRDPNTSVLADGASISYLPTLTTINEPTAIIRHLQAQGRQVKKKAEKTINAIEGGNGLYMDTETTLELITSGGVYLPGLDDNFLADKIVTLPLSYVVHFNAQQKIQHIRVQWEQASLLKQVEVIGARGRNWPIREGKDQIKLIRDTTANSTSDGADRPSTADSRRPTTSDTSNSARSHSSSTSATRGEKSNLSLFQPREEDERSYVHNGDVVSPRESAKPTNRDLSEILSKAHDSSIREASPAKRGAGKGYNPSRLFDQEPMDEQPKPANDIKLDPKKFQHFEFGDPDGEVAIEEAAAQKAADDKRKKHASQWDFADFTTPDKPKLKVLPSNERNFSWSDDEGETSPVKRPVVHKGRKDAAPHFEFTDEVTPVADRKTQHLHNTSNAGQGLYKDHVLGNDDDDSAKKPLSTMTNISNANRQRDFGAHYSMADSSPSTTPGAQNGSNKENGTGKANEGQRKVLNTLSSHWDLYDNSPEVAKDKTMYKTSGNGMGGRKGVSAHWAVGDEDYTEETPKRTEARAGSRQQDKKSFWDF